MGYALQMSWMPSLPNQKRKNGPPLGLKNLGNTCYLNSVLQCLTYTPPLANFCLKYLHSSSCDLAKVPAEKKSECPFCIIEKRIARSLRIEGALDSPIKINNCLKIFAENFHHGRQEDAHEFLRYVIDACHNTCLRIKKLQQQRRKSVSSENGNGNTNCTGNGNTVVKEIFGGALQSQIKCLLCGAESNKVDEIMDISLDVLHSKSLKEALMKFFQPEVLDGNNKYKCENCKKLVAARKQMTILQALNVLVIQLKRFDGIFGGKFDKKLLLRRSWCFQVICAKQVRILIQNIIFWYNCTLWFLCKFRTLLCIYQVSTLQQVLSEKVYILFFSRPKQRLVPLKSGFVENGKLRKEFSDHNSQIGNKTSSFDNSKLIKSPASGSIRILLHKKEKQNDEEKKKTMKKSFFLANGNGKTLDNDKQRSTKKSSLKRKFQIDDTCILLAKDDNSRTQVYEFKQRIAKEASLLLNSSGWSNEVYNFMQSKKQLCAQRSTSHDLRRVLISDAKSNFITKIPQSLKGRLIEQKPSSNTTTCALNHARIV